jgi:hypothetical protein
VPTLDLPVTHDQDDRPTGGVPVVATLYPSNAFLVEGDRGVRAELAAYRERDADPVSFDLRARPGFTGLHEINVVFFLGDDSATPLGQVTTVVRITRGPTPPDLQHTHFPARRPVTGEPPPDAILTITHTPGSPDTLWYKFEWRSQGWKAIDAGKRELARTVGEILEDWYDKSAAYRGRPPRPARSTPTRKRSRILARTSTASW